MPQVLLRYACARSAAPRAARHQRDTLPDLAFSPQALAWVVVGVALGALIAWIIARVAAGRARGEHERELRRLQAERERLHGVMRDQGDRLRLQDDELRDLSRLRKEREAVLEELDLARRHGAEAQSSLDAARSAAREAEMRLGGMLEMERQEASARRAALASELHAAQEVTAGLRAELAAARDGATRTIARLETDLDASRQMLARTADELHDERAAAAQRREELRRQVAQLEEARSHLEQELVAARRAVDEKGTSLRSYIATLREQYALACAERDAATREVERQRRRAEDAVRDLEDTRLEFARKLAAEHRESVDLVTRVWHYVHDYPRLPAWASAMSSASDDRGDRQHAPAARDSGAPVEVEHGLADAPSMLDGASARPTERSGGWA